MSLPDAADPAMIVDEEEAAALAAAASRAARWELRVVRGMRVYARIFTTGKVTQGEIAIKKTFAYGNK